MIMQITIMNLGILLQSYFYSVYYLFSAVMTISTRVVYYHCCPCWMEKCL